MDQAVRAGTPGRKLSGAQRAWLKFCLMGVLLTNTVCWKAFERAGLGGYRAGALSWMFRHSKVAWDGLLRASVVLVLRQHGITEGVLVADDSDHRRAKRTGRIWKAHKLFDKKTGGYFNGQCLVFLVLVTPKLTVPVGFRFHEPDPELSAWRREDRRLKRAGVRKADRPAAPAPNPAYPGKAEQALDLIGEFRRHHPGIRVKAVVADAWFGTQGFLDEASRLCGHVQAVSQLRNNQNVRFRGRDGSLTDYFRAYPGVPQRVAVRGGKEVEVVVGSARLHVNAHARKRFVVALKYPGETEYRFLVATDLSWRTLDIVAAYTLRWLAEVFFEDWKLYEGWGQMAKQPGEEGSSRSLALSLLLDHALLLHPEQRARLENHLPACTVGSLRQFCQGEALLEFVRSVLAAENIAERLEQLAEKVKTWFPLAPSGKHMSGRDLGRQQPSPSLKYRAAQMATAG
ncbi:transposase [Methylomagnum ishizawai]|uniref:transposase n=1 Tax=Methylomagnum ishizawai TaxID=1760988 RepID=UPI001C33EFA3|nr:transposase [Methylomagnum ishizawai]BBL76800.1 hypothetical protein MishRS11D_38980 [Methylomagnum ishizawai]